MPIFCFSITLDEDDPLERPSSCESHEDAIQEGCNVLMGLVYMLRPATASCVVHEGTDASAAPVGTWSYKAPGPAPHWSGRHD